MSIAPVSRIAVIVVAAGSGTRLGAHEPKAFVSIDSHSILWHSLEGVFATLAKQIVVVAPDDRLSDALTEAQSVPGYDDDRVCVIAGGATRQASVAAGLSVLGNDIDVVLVHDAARALTPRVVFTRVADAIAAGATAVIPTLAVVDTLKRVAGSTVVGPVDRSHIASAQTPQGFRRDTLVGAYSAATEEFTDDAALVAGAGHTVDTVDGDARSFKITTMADLERARGIIASHIAVAVPARATTVIPRVGVGTDVHAFGGDGNLWLAGLEWPGERALSGHSDGDAVAHAIVDALLGAAGLGDIGTHFGTDYPEYAGAHASVFLARTNELLAEAGWSIGNVSVQFQANRPRFATRRFEAESVLSAALGGAAVSVSATTTDGLGFTGEGEGLSAFAVALLVRT
ncbi:2-C-methyl-D-erythritol 4-phosphate cytidylyltransferase (plasmid) [Coraliomargarita sp. W4R53]